MKYTSLLILSVLSGLILTNSCSRSLTDYGYQGGEVSTYNPSSAGPARIMNQANSFTNWQNFHYDNVWYYLAINPSKEYIAKGRTIIMADVSKENALTKDQKRKMSFLQTFYVDLYNNFRLSKFDKKYLKSCSPEVRKILIENKQDSIVGKLFGGWQVFIPNTDSRPNNCTIKYDGEDDWYKITPNNSQNSQILVKVIRENNMPLIAAIKR